MSKICTLYQDNPRLCQLKKTKAKRTGEPFACAICKHEPGVEQAVCRGCGKVIEPRQEKSQGMHKSCHIRLYTEWSQSGVAEPFEWWLENHRAVIVPDPGEDHEDHEDEAFVQACIDANEELLTEPDHADGWPDIESLPVVSGWKKQPNSDPECWFAHGRLNFSSSAVKAFGMQQFSHCRVRSGQDTVIVELLREEPADDDGAIKLNRKVDGCNIYASLVRFLKKATHLNGQRVKLHQLRDDILAAKFQGAA